MRAAAVILSIVCAVLAGCGQQESTPVEQTKTNASTKICARAVYAIQHSTWNCERMMEELADCDEIRIAFVWRTFGDETACLDRVLADERTSLVEAHVINDTCFPERGRTCGAHEYNYGRQIGDVDVTSLRAWLRAFRAWMLERPAGPEWIISPYLEANLDAPHAELAIWETRAALPEYRIAWNPVSPRGPWDVGEDLREVHGLGFAAPNAGWIANNDGQDAADLSSYISANVRALAAFVWHRSDNCLSGQGFTPPLERDCR